MQNTDDRLLHGGGQGLRHRKKCPDLFGSAVLLINTAQKAVSRAYVRAGGHGKFQKLTSLSFVTVVIESLCPLLQRARKKRVILVISGQLGDVRRTVAQLQFRVGKSCKIDDGLVIQGQYDLSVIFDFGDVF